MSGGEFKIDLPANAKPKHFIREGRRFGAHLAAQYIETIRLAYQSGAEYTEAFIDGPRDRQPTMTRHRLFPTRPAR